MIFRGSFEPGFYIGEFHLIVAILLWGALGVDSTNVWIWVFAGATVIALALPHFMHRAYGNSYWRTLRFRIATWNSGCANINVLSIPFGLTFYSGYTFALACKSVVHKQTASDWVERLYRPPRVPHGDPLARFHPMEIRCGMESSGFRLFLPTGTGAGMGRRGALSPNRLPRAERNRRGDLIQQRLRATGGILERCRRQ
jgi:hypothetical protein